jgi:hypothetical protein
LHGSCNPSVCWVRHFLSLAHFPHFGVDDSSYCPDHPTGATALSLTTSERPDICLYQGLTAQLCRSRALPHSFYCPTSRGSYPSPAAGLFQSAIGWLSFASRHCRIFSRLSVRAPPYFRSHLKLHPWRPVRSQLVSPLATEGLLCQPWAPVIGSDTTWS